MKQIHEIQGKSKETHLKLVQIKENDKNWKKSNEDIDVL